MRKQPSITLLMAEDDDGHALLVEDILAGTGLPYRLIRFSDGQEIMDFLEGRRPGENYEPHLPCVLLLDIRMPKVDGLEVLRRVKENPDWRLIPVHMLTTTDDPRDVARCHELGCNSYIHKPVDYAKFSESIRRLGLFLEVSKVPVRL